MAWDRIGQDEKMVNKKGRKKDYVRKIKWKGGDGIEWLRQD